MERRTFVCDVCGVEKKESNHWWRLYSLPGVLDGSCLFLGSWDAKFVAGDPVKQIHLCGHACVIKKVSEFMGEKS